ncbi:hypothetical protein PMIN07_008322 [Paraphaeosphaeria minitans]
MAMTARSHTEHVRPGDLLLVVHEFQARSPDELSLVRGDRVELTERDDDFGDGWFLGKNTATGDSGLFPEGTCKASEISLSMGCMQPKPALLTPAQSTHAPSRSQPSPPPCISAPLRSLQRNLPSMSCSPSGWMSRPPLPRCL